MYVRITAYISCEVPLDKIYTFPDASGLLKVLSFRSNCVPTILCNKNILNKFFFFFNKT